MPTRIIKYLLIGLSLLILFHYESTYLGPLKVSYIWKGILLLLLSKSIILKKSKLFVYKPFLFLAFLQLINIEIIEYPSSAIINFFTTLIIPIIGLYLLKLETKNLKLILIFFSSFFILSFIPYELGILKSIEAGYDLESYGLDSKGLIGPFQNPHGASIALAGALLVVLYFWFEKQYNKLILSILFILGFYFLIGTYVRIGLAMFFLGSIPLLFYFSFKSKRTFFKMLVFSSIILLLSLSWIAQNEVVMNRIKGQSKYGKADTFESLGSGRGAIYIASIQIFREMNPIEKILGIGISEQRKRISYKYGLEIGSHNGFLDILLSSGLVGLIILLWTFLNFLRLSNTNITSSYKILYRSILYAFFAMVMFQGYKWVYLDLLMMTTIAIIYKQSYFKESPLNDVVHPKILN